MADLVIMGLGIPKERSLWLCIKTDGTVYNIKPGGIGTAHAVGTAVPLPEGHGRIGDLDAIKADIEGFIECMTKAGAVVDGEMLWGKLLDALANAKTIVPAEGGTDDEHV